MGTYVISDIHGCFNEFNLMLKYIGFSDRDNLILAGDYIDRGSQNIEMLNWLKRRPSNVVSICGNHDREYIANVDLLVGIDKKEGLETDVDSNEEAIILYDSMSYMLKNLGGNMSKYFDIYGGIRQMLEKGATLRELTDWAAMLREMPLVHELDVSGRRYIIVHAGYIEDLTPVSDKYTDIVDFYLYAREEAYIYGGREHCTVVAGHTPTIVEGEITYNAGEVFRYYNEAEDCVYFDIDCGCVMRSRNEWAALACIRLEDEAVFYV